MGQTASRNRTLTPSSPATASTVSTADREVVSDDSVDDTPTPAPKSRRSARSSVRRSLLKLVKPRSSQVEAQETARPSHSRKSWRTSRRWSKAAPTLAHDENSSASSSRLPPPSEKPPQLTDDPDAVPSMPQTHIVSENEPRQEPHHTNDVGSWLNDEDPSSSTDHVVFSPDHFTPTQDLPDVPEDVSPPPTINQPDLPSPPSTASPRQFPPPGTLVVVQGVVHTTDVPRVPGADTPSDLPDAQPVVPSQSTSVPRPSTPTSASTEHSTSRNRMSALLRSRPASMASAVEVAAPESDLVTDAVSATTESAEVTPPAPEPPRHSGPISSSSIDVLGTLLSVAAAATAASLLTGSSEPILTSGLTPPTPNGTAPPLNDPARPLSPTPSSGSIDAIGSRTERMRLAWSSIRDRLGMRPPRSERNEDGQEGGDARERMLTEMARAFNLGLGINNNGSPEDNTAQSAATENPEVPTTPQLPAEGSFERFLVDLQLDLRATLSHRVEPRQREEVTPPPVASQPQSPEGISESDWLPIAVPTPSSPSQAPPRIANIGAEDDDDDMPALQDVSDSDSEFSNTDIDSLPEQNVRPTPNVDIPPPSAEPQPPSDRINWWRLYRFPPIPAPRGASPLEVNLRPPGSASIPLPPAMTANASSSPSGDLTSSPLPSSHTAPHPSPPNTVVPVIVVGLQSVSVSGSWPPRDAERPHDTRETASTASGQPPPPPPESLEDDGEPRPDTPRGRRWHSRAASALRNLRPGRRPDAPDQPTEDPVGSRTFLIYVIGGYYPPDHSIVTGEPHNLDSFEALLDLAEILGQVKPPTASKEEIERSHLEVIKATQVPEYENDRKISSNCTERCLICLDDYAPEDDVRVMGCRHAFHKACVDTWLQTGKNNCPACRGTGVSTDTSAEPVPAQ